MEVTWVGSKGVPHSSPKQIPAVILTELILCTAVSGVVGLRIGAEVAVEQGLIDE